MNYDVNINALTPDALLDWYPGLPFLVTYCAFIAGMAYGWWEHDM